MTSTDQACQERSKAIDSLKQAVLSYGEMTATLSQRAAVSYILIIETILTNFPRRCSRHWKKRRLAFGVNVVHGPMSVTGKHSK